MGRDVTVVLVDSSGELLGALPGFPVDLPYWQETAEIVHEAWGRYALRIDVLRLLTTELPVPHGGAVTYLAEVSVPTPVALEPVSAATAALALRDEPLRSAYARLGGPARTLAWARSALEVSVEAWQQRTWNLSAIWRLESGDTTTWLKEVPSFFWHEPVVLDWLADVTPELAPTVIAHDDEGRMLLENASGDDLYECDLAQLVRIGELAHGIQLAGIDATDGLLGAGVPDRRGTSLATWIRDRLTGWVEGHPAEALLDELDARLAALAECGLPDTLVHGDAHPGNVRSDGTRTVFLDWGDAFVGNPVFDVRGMTGGRSVGETQSYAAAWTSWWERSVPGSDPARAVELSQPLASLRLAAVYADFVANIEPTQRPFHDADVLANLDAAALTLGR